LKSKAKLKKILLSTLKILNLNINLLFQDLISESIEEFKILNLNINLLFQDLISESIEEFKILNLNINLLFQDLISESIEEVYGPEEKRKDEYKDTGLVPDKTEDAKQFEKWAQSRGYSKTQVEKKS
jgi:hypothetical protein